MGTARLPRERSAASGCDGPQRTRAAHCARPPLLRVRRWWYVRTMINTDAVRERLEQGRAALARHLRALADEVEHVPLDRAAEMIAGCWDRMQEIDAEIARVLRGDH